MPYTPIFTVDAPERAKIDATPGPLLLEFGVDWCPHCQGAQALLAAALDRQPAVSHLKIEDGPGRRLGRTYKVKLWPTLIFLRDGQEVARLVRPTAQADIDRALADIAG